MNHPIKDMVDAAQVMRAVQGDKGLCAVSISESFAGYLQCGATEDMRGLMRCLFDERVQEVGFNRAFNEYLMEAAQRGF